VFSLQRAWYVEIASAFTGWSIGDAANRQWRYRHLPAIAIFT
jgi:hypothetical protein